MAGIFWLASYPKSGNTWMRIFLDNLMRESAVPVDINALHTDSIASSRAWLDDLLCAATIDLDVDEVDRQRAACYAWADAQATRNEYHKIHDANRTPASTAPLATAATCRGVLYIVRNPLDVASSAANHWRVSLDVAIAHLCRPDMTLVRRGRSPNQVRQLLLDWSGHVRSWLDGPALPLHVVRYEDLLAQPLDTFRAVARFLELPDAADRVQSAIDHSSFEQLAHQEDESGFCERLAGVPRFFRSGRAGGWRETLDASQVARIVDAHGPTMRRLGYLDADGRPT